MNKRWLILGFLPLATIAHAGTVVHLQRRSLPDGKLQPHLIIYAQNGQFRMDSLDARGHVRDFVLVRDGNIWQVDVDARTFYLFDKSALAGQQQALQGQMQAMLQRLPPEKRAVMETRMQAMLQRAEQTSITFTDTGHSDHVGSWPCELWQLQRNGKTVSDACIASPGVLPGGRELATAAQTAAATAAKVLAALPMARAAAQRMAVYANHSGFPVRTRELSGGKPEDEQVAASIESRLLPADTFAIPKGFTQTTMAHADD